MLVKILLSRKFLFFVWNVIQSLRRDTPLLQKVSLDFCAAANGNNLVTTNYIYKGIRMHSESWEDHYDFSSGEPVKRNRKEVILDPESLILPEEMASLAQKKLNELLSNNKKRKV